MPRKKIVSKRVNRAKFAEQLIDRVFAGMQKGLSVDDSIRGALKMLGVRYTEQLAQALMSVYKAGMRDASKSVGITLGFSPLDKAMVRKVLYSPAYDMVMHNYDLFAKQEIRDTLEKVTTVEPKSIKEIKEELIGKLNVVEKRGYNIARTEMANLYNISLEESYKKMDPTGERWDYRWFGPDDMRTTDLCEHLKEITKNGMPLSELKRIVKEEAQKGQFAVQGFKYDDSRPWVPHFQCRHTFIAERRREVVKEMSKEGKTYTENGKHYQDGYYIINTVTVDPKTGKQSKRKIYLDRIGGKGNIVLNERGEKTGEIVIGNVEEDREATIEDARMCLDYGKIVPGKRSSWTKEMEKGRIYLKPGEKAPEAMQEFTGPRGGRYYESGAGSGVGTFKPSVMEQLDTELEDLKGPTPEQATAPEEANPLTLPYGGIISGGGWEPHTEYEVGAMRIGEAVHCILGSLCKLHYTEPEWRKSYPGYGIERGHIDEELDIIIRDSQDFARSLYNRQLIERGLDDKSVRGTIGNLQPVGQYLIQKSQEMKALVKTDDVVIKETADACYDVLYWLGKAMMEADPLKWENAFKNPYLIRAIVDLKNVIARHKVGHEEEKSTLVEDEDYMGEHRPPGPEDGASLDDVTGGGNIYPDDVYGPNGLQYYGTGEDRLDRETYWIIKRFKGKPNAVVTIYRAVPHVKSAKERLAELEVQMKRYLARHTVPAGEDAEGWYDRAWAEREQLRSVPEVEQEEIKINPGDWVSINRNYVKEHGESALNGKYKIISKKVKAKEIFTNGDSWHEWGYYPGGVEKEKVYLNEGEQPPQGKQEFTGPRGGRYYEGDPRENVDVVDPTIGTEYPSAEKQPEWWEDWKVNPLSIEIEGSGRTYRIVARLGDMVRVTAGEQGWTHFKDYEMISIRDIVKWWRVDPNTAYGKWVYNQGGKVTVYRGGNVLYTVMGVEPGGRLWKLKKKNGRLFKVDGKQIIDYYPPEPVVEKPKREVKPREKKVRVKPNIDMATIIADWDDYQSVKDITPEMRADIEEYIRMDIEEGWEQLLKAKQHTVGWMPVGYEAVQDKVQAKYDFIGNTLNKMRTRKGQTFFTTSDLLDIIINSTIKESPASGLDLSKNRVFMVLEEREQKHIHSLMVLLRNAGFSDADSDRNRISFGMNTLDVTALKKFTTMALHRGVPVDGPKFKTHSEMLNKLKKLPEKVVDATVKTMSSCGEDLEKLEIEMLSMVNVKNFDDRSTGGIAYEDTNVFGISTMAMTNTYTVKRYGYDELREAFQAFMDEEVKWTKIYTYGGVDWENMTEIERLRHHLRQPGRSMGDERHRLTQQLHLVVAHEIGHHIFYKLRKNPTVLAEFEAFVGSGEAVITDYAHHRKHTRGNLPHEPFAECYSFYKAVPAYFKFVSPNVYEWFKRLGLKEGS